MLNYMPTVKQLAYDKNWTVNQAHLSCDINVSRHYLRLYGLKLALSMCSHLGIAKL